MNSPFATHEVLNQSPPFEDVNLFTSDRALQEAVAREGAAEAAERLAAFGAAAGSREAFEIGRLANEHPPRLKTHDPRGRRLDAVEYHPAYHTLMRRSMAEALHRAPGQASTLPWSASESTRGTAWPSGVAFRSCCARTRCG